MLSLGKVSKYFINYSGISDNNWLSVSFVKFLPMIFNPRINSCKSWFLCYIALSILSLLKNVNTFEDHQQNSEVILINIKIPIFLHIKNFIYMQKKGLIWFLTNPCLSLPVRQILSIGNFSAPSRRDKIGSTKCF